MNVLEEIKNGNIPDDGIIFKSVATIKNKLETHKNVVVSISGGSDSDDMLHLFEMVNKDVGSNITYVFFDTGLEYDATYEHIKELESKYNIEIKVIKAKVPIPISCKKYGQPFLNKRVSELIERLQRHNFQWEDEPLEVLLERYPNCRSALRWWCNDFGENSKFNIKYNKNLKEFMILNPPKFLISSKCCKGAKKDVIHDFLKENSFDMSCTGVRKAEGGARSSAYKNCFTAGEGDDIDQYRPIFFYTNETKKKLEKFYGIKHSKCYTVYGLKRTGCAGCPYGKDFEYELKIMKKYEPKLYKAVCYIFKDSYEYTIKYNEFKERFNNKKIKFGEQLSMKLPIPRR